MDQSFIHSYHLSAVAVLANRSPRESVTVSAAAGSNLARINCILNCLNQRGECFWIENFSVSYLLIFSL